MCQSEVKNGAIHLKRVQDSSSLLDAKPTDRILELRSHAVGLRGFSVVFGNKAAKLSLALDYTPAHWHEGLIEDRVIHSRASVWSLGVVVSDPSADDVVGLFGTEAHDVVQGFFLQASYDSFAVCVGFGRFEGRSDASNALAFPESPESEREFCISVAHKELGPNTEVVEPVDA